MDNPVQISCPACGFRGTEGSATCGTCGAALPARMVRCERCGIPNDASAHFCANCGLLRSSPREERKYVTVLFADIEDSTAMVAEADPEDAAEQIQPAVTAMREAVRRHHGTVNRVAGDGIMALFGAPLAYEDHAVRACSAALEIVRDVTRRTDGAVKVRVGMHSGEVLLRGVENDFATDYDAYGGTPHVARRLERLAAPNSVRLSAQTLRLVEGHVQVRSLGRIDLRGLRDPVEVFELLGRDAGQSRFAVRFARGLTEFVGREREMAMLLAELERAGRGECRVVEIAGEAGIGKSRLVHELVVRAREKGWEVLSGAAEAQDRIGSHRPLGRLLRAWLEVGERESQGEVQAQLERTAGRLLGPGGLEVHLAALQSLLDLPIADERWWRLDPPERRDAIGRALAALAMRYTERGPHLLIVDDGHWADEETLRTLGALARELHDAPLVLIVTARSEPHAAGRMPQASRMVLSALPVEAQQQMLVSMIGRGGALDALRESLFDRSGGNPLFLEEFVRGLIDAGTLRGSPGAFALEGGVGGLDVPASLYGVIGARIDRLDPALKSRLQTAAVVGRQFSVRILAALGDAYSLRDDLDALERLGFVARPPGVGDVRYAFRHALIQHVAYLALPRAVRAEVHARIVGVIEDLYADRIAEYVEELAEHALAGRLWGLAARYRLKSCVAAIERSASREAVAIFERALETFAQMPPDEAAQRAAIDLRLAVVNALMPLGDHARLLETVREAQRLAESHGDERRVGVCCAHLGTALWLSAENEQALASGVRGSELGQRLRNQALYLGSRFATGMAYHGLGQYRRAIETHGEMLRAFTGKMETVRSGWSGYPVIFARTYIGHSHLELGELEPARELIVSGSELADRFAHPYSQAMIRWAYGQLLLWTQRTDEAIALLGRTLELCLQHDVLTMYTGIAAQFAAAYLQRGDAELALSVLQPVLDPKVYHRSGKFLWVELFLAAASAHLLRGDLAHAEPFAREAEQLCRVAQARGQLAYALEVRAQLAAARGDAAGREQARAHQREALDLTEQLGMRLLRERLAARVF
jgi:class 3 adenylate cyclase/tetratricopeptide (TPR) repeat protein